MKKTDQALSIDGNIEFHNMFKGIVSIASPLRKKKFVLEDFVLQKKIGSGAFGKVYKCKLKKNKEIYAAKISKKSFENCSSDDIMSISREVDILSKLNHPAILNFIFYSPINFQGKNKPVIITEFAPGGTLADFIEIDQFDNTNWNDTNKLIVIYGISSAMSYLHSYDIIHRDLKPENILIDDFFHPKIADFGMSKFKEVNQNGYNSISKTKGTPIYMAPEIWRCQEYSKASDVYAFGMILYEILSQQRTMRNINIYMLIGRVATGYRPEFKSKFPRRFKELIEKCWHQEVDQRPSFDSIVNLLKNDKSFITEKVDETKFRKYVEYIDNYNSSFQMNKHTFYKMEDEEEGEEEYDDYEEEEEDDKKTAESNENIKNLLKINTRLFPPKMYMQLEREKSKQVVLEAENDIEQQYVLGVCLIKGYYDFPHNPTLGFKYIRMSREYQPSLTYYIKALAKGKIIPANPQKALNLVEKYVNDQSIRLYFYGIIFKAAQKYSQAENLFMACLQQGIIQGAYELGKLYSDKKNEELYNQQKALMFFRTGTVYKNSDCIYHYAMFLIDRDDIDSISTGLSLLEKLANEENPKACFSYAGFLENNGQDNLSAQYYKRAADKGHIPSIIKYSLFLKVIKKDKTYLKYLKKAADHGDINSIFYYATNLFESDPKEALKYAIIAARNGIVDAMHFCGTVLSNGLCGEQDFDEAIEFFKMGIEKDDDESMVGYAQMLQSGIGVPQDYEEAIKYYKRAIEKGNDTAMNNYAWMLEHGEGVPVDYKNAEKYYKIAMAKGNTAAVNNYAIMINNGRGVEKDSKKALEMYKKGAEEGIPESMFNYANLLDQSDDINDQKESIKYFKLAANNGDVPAMVRYAEKLLFGENCAVNKKEAAEFFKMAADKGDSQAMQYYATMCLDGDGIKKDLKNAAKYFKMRADLGDALCMNQYAYTLLMIDRNDVNILREAMKYFKMAFDKGFVDSIVNISSILLNKNGFQYDIDEAMKYLKVAVEKGNINAMYNYGYTYLKEFNDAENGLKYIKMAADGGLVKAMIRYAEILKETSGDMNEIAKYYKMAADKGDHDGIVYYAAMILNKEYKKASIEDAAVLLKKAADERDPNAATIYAHLLRNGIGVERDEDEAKKYDKIANS